MIKDRYLTTAEAAKMLGFTQDHVRRLIREDKIKAEKIGHVWLTTAKAFSHVKRLRKLTIKDSSDGNCE